MQISPSYAVKRILALALAAFPKSAAGWRGASPIGGAKFLSE
jgi:hypothetical protein